MANTIEVKVPDIGGYDDVPVIEVLVAVGDTIAKDQGLVTLESDKATMEVPSSHAGVVKELKVKVGDTLSEGSVVLVLEAEGAGTTPLPRAGEADARSATGEGSVSAAMPPPQPSPASGGGGEKPAATSSGPVEAKVPDIGDYTDVPVIEVLVSVGDRVWVDVNRDGAQSEGEPSAPVIIVNLYDADGGLVSTTETDDEGFYSFIDLIPDVEYVV